MLAVKVTVDERSLKEAAHILRAIPRAMPRVMRRAIKRTVDMAATDLKRRVSAQITVKKREIAKGIVKKQPTYANLTGSIGAEEFRLRLIAFPGTKQTTKHGVTYRISRTEGRKRIEHGFIARMPSGHRGVFVRGGPSRLPLREPRGPSIWKIITGKAGILKAVTDAAGKRLGKHINDQISVEFKRWSR